MRYRYSFNIPAITAAGRLIDIAVPSGAVMKILKFEITNVTLPAEVVHVSLEKITGATLDTGTALTELKHRLASASGCTLTSAPTYSVAGSAGAQLVEAAAPAMVTWDGIPEDWEVHVLRDGEEGALRLINTPGSSSLFVGSILVDVE